MPRLAPFAFLAVLACNTSALDQYDNCSIDIKPKPDSALPGEVVTLDGGPFSAPWDTVVRVDGTDSTISDVTRTGCDQCDACRADAACLSCGVCDGCTALCDACVQTVTFFVPDVAAGPQPVVLYNQHGTSDPVTLTVLGQSSDTDPHTDTDGAGIR